MERKCFRNLTRFIGEYNVFFECLLECSETYYRDMLTFISDIERKKLLNQWMGISMDIEDISKKPNQILPRYTETSTDGIWQIKK